MKLCLKYYWFVFSGHGVQFGYVTCNQATPLYNFNGYVSQRRVYSLLWDWNCWPVWEQTARCNVLVMKSVMKYRTCQRMFPEPSWSALESNSWWVHLRTRRWRLWTQTVTVAPSSVDDLAGQLHRRRSRAETTELHRARCLPTIPASSQLCTINSMHNHHHLPYRCIHR